MSLSSFQIRGYATIFAPQEIDGAREEILPTAFDELGQRSIALRHAVHEGVQLARTGDCSMRIFSDHRGLAFEASLRMDRIGLASYNDIVGGRIDGASISGSMAKSEDVVVDGSVHRTVSRMDVDHIALTCVPASRGTGCWPADIPANELPPHLRALAAHWQRGSQSAIIKRREHVAALRAALRVVEAEETAPSSDGAGVFSYDELADLAREQARLRRLMER